MSEVWLDEMEMPLLLAKHAFLNTNSNTLSHMMKESEETRS